MNIVVIGGTGLIGTQLVERLRRGGHTAIAASPRGGVNSVTGEGLGAALAEAEVLVDVSNSPSFEDVAVMDFFTASTTNLIAAARAAGVGHYVALSVVGTDRLPDSGYFRAKVAQEKLIRESGIPYSIVQATQFFEFVGAIVQWSANGEALEVPSALIQPIASAEVAAAVGDVALGPPVNGTVEIAGPEPFTFQGLLQQYLAINGDAREVRVNPQASYFGARIAERALVPAGDSRLGLVHFGAWLSRPVG
jgi:uncharacterized protein YbjT (DUF2867 family)